MHTDLNKLDTSRRFRNPTPLGYLSAPTPGDRTDLATSGHLETKLFQ